MITRLPPELQLLIAEILPPKDINSLLRTSRHFHALLDNVLYDATVRSPTILEPALTRVILESRVSTLSRFLGHGAAVDTRVSCQCLPPNKLLSVWVPRTLMLLSLSVCYNQTAIARLLLRRGADINARDNGDMPLHIAARVGSEEMVRLLLENGAEINAVDRCGTRRPLLLAMLTRNVAALRAFLGMLGPEELDDESYLKVNGGR